MPDDRAPEVGDVASAAWKAGWIEGFEALRRRLTAEAMIKNDFTTAQKLISLPVEPPSVVTGYEKQTTS